MISKKDLSDVEMDTLTKSCSPTMVITANGEVQTHEEAIVCVKELDIFLTLKVLESTPAVLSLGKLCDEHGYSYEWINGQKPHLIKNGIRIQCNTENFVPIVVLGLSTSSSSSLLSSTSMTHPRQEIDPNGSSRIRAKHNFFKETRRSLQKFLEPERNPKVIYTDNSLEFGKACEDLSWNNCTSTPHRSETNGIAERAVRRVKEGTSAVLLQSGLDEKW